MLDRCRCDEYSHACASKRVEKGAVLKLSDHSRRDALLLKPLFQGAAKCNADNRQQERSSVQRRWKIAAIFPSQRRRGEERDTAGAQQMTEGAYSPLLTLVGVASRFTARPVVDDTGIEGDYDFSLTFAAETDAGLPRGYQGNAALSEPAESFADAVKKYGLRIAPRKETIDMFVITHVEKTPMENQGVLTQIKTTKS